MASVRPLASLLLGLALASCREPPPPVVAEPPPETRTATVSSAEPGGAQVDAGPRCAAAPGHLSSRAVSVAEGNGCIVARDAAGREAYLTTTGVDDWPELSPDGKTVAFRRHGSTLGRPTTIHQAFVETGDPELLVTEDGPDGPHEAGIELWGLGAPKFSVDGARVFFHVWNGDLGALCAVDVATRKVRWILTALQAEVIRKGPYRGHFFALRHEHDTLYGPPEDRCYVLHSMTGKKLRRVPCKDPDGPDATIYDPVARRSIGM
jgi:hypothetical protein